MGNVYCHDTQYLENESVNNPESRSTTRALSWTRGLGLGRTQAAI